MQQILKRLELIKTSIALEDEEIIELQIIKIKSLSYDAEVGNIITALESSDFAVAMQAIETYITDNTGLIVYEDKELSGLKLELKVLERHLLNLVEQKNDCDTDIDAFNHEYSIRLGPIIQEVLGLREKILYQHISVKKKAFSESKAEYDAVKKTVVEAKRKIADIEPLLEDLDEFSDEYDERYAEYQTLKEDLNQQEELLTEKRNEVKQASDNLDDDPINAEYEEAQEDSASFEQEYIDFIAVETLPLNEEQEKELKLAYRKACRLCHPDTVPDELKQQAHAIMLELNAAKKIKDLEQVNDILLSLQTGGSFDVASDTLQDKALLSRKITETKNRINAVELEINELKLSEPFQLIKTIDDKEAYFDELKMQLETESEQLKQQLQGLENEEHEKVTSEPEDNYWTEEF